MSIESVEMAFLESSFHRFKSYKQMAEASITQITEQQFFEPPAPGSNSIALIVQHMAGNMLSRWTDFLTTDGEKQWRNRDAEFEMPTQGKVELMHQWALGWDCLLETIKGLKAEDLKKEVFIRKEPLSATDAIIRQLMHYSYHVGQIVLLAKWMAGPDWQSLSIPKGQSEAYNASMARGRQGA